MRLGVIADVHANLHALDAVLTKLGQEGVDRYVCLGDLVGYGPQPNEVVERLAELAIPCVAGNHDLVASGLADLDRAGANARPLLEWTRSELSDDARSYLVDLPSQIEIDGVLAVHGAIGDPWRYVRRAPDAFDQIEATEELGKATLLLGHTHRQMVVTSERGAVATSEWTLARRKREVVLGGTAVVNPGAVGQSREPRALARAAILDLDPRRVRLLAVRYDDGACRAELRRRGLPSDACHARPPVRKVIRQALRDRADRKMEVIGGA